MSKDRELKTFMEMREKLAFGLFYKSYLWKNDDGEHFAEHTWKLLELGLKAWNDYKDSDTSGDCETFCRRCWVGSFYKMADDIIYGKKGGCIT